MMDPPDEFERNRNNVIYSFQQNRNPFIDNPYFAELIWNNGTLSSVIITDVRLDPSKPEANQPVTVRATISSTQGSISDATLSYGYSFENLTEEIDMEGAGTDLYAVIPGQPEGTTIYFNITAEDGSNEFTTVTYNYYVPKTFNGTLTSIYDVQGQADSSPFEDEVKSITGIVTANFGDGYFLQKGSGEWNGLYIYDPGRNPNVGDSLVLTGTISEFYEKTEMKNITGYYFISGNHALPEPVVITCDEAVEPYEGVLIRVNNAVCTEEDSNFGMWTVNDGTGDLLIQNTNVFEYIPTEGESYNITGPLDYKYSEWKIHLRFSTDVSSGGDFTAPEVQSVEVITATDIKIQFSEEVEQTSAETLSNYSINNDVSITEAKQHSIVKSQVFLTTSTLPGGEFELSVSNVADLNGNSMETVVIPFTASGINDPTVINSQEIFPNPSDGHFQVEWNYGNAQAVLVNLYNLTGKKLFSEELNPVGNMLTFDFDDISNGLYIIEIRSDNVISRSKVMIRE
jgi:hypothetical protein